MERGKLREKSVVRIVVAANNGYRKRNEVYEREEIAALMIAAESTGNVPTRYSS